MVRIAGNGRALTLVVSFFSGVGTTIKTPKDKDGIRTHVSRGELYPKNTIVGGTFPD